MTYEISIIEVGVIPHLPRSLYLGEEEEGVIDVPCFSYLVSDGERAMLVDSGPDRERALAAGFEIEGETKEALLSGLSQRGLAPRDVELVVHTHLHYDHAQNDELFENARVVVQREELDWALGRDESSFYSEVAGLARHLGERLETIEGPVELWPGVRTLFNKGHTPGHQSVLVETRDGPTVICGDIVSLTANTERVAAVCPNVAETKAFLERAKKMGWQMLPSHDPLLRDHPSYVKVSS